MASPTPAAPASSGAGAALLMKYGPSWGIPSISPGCIQVEPVQAYLRMAGINFVVDIVKTTGASPTGCLPCVETPNGITGGTQHASNDFAAADAAISHLRGFNDLDQSLTGAAPADCSAFSCLLDVKLQPAVRYAMWCEWKSLRELPEIFGHSLPWPLGYLVPYTMAFSVRRSFKGCSAREIYSDAAAAIKALDVRLEAAQGGPFLCGASPSSADAKAFGMLAYIVASPIVAPILKDEVRSARNLVEYVQHISKTFFSTVAPAAHGDSDTRAWSSAAAGVFDPAASGAGMTDKQTVRWSYAWLSGVGVLALGFLLASTAVVEVMELQGEEEEEDGDADDDGGEE